MAKPSLLNITPSWVHQRDPEQFTDEDLNESLDNYLRRLKGSFAFLADHLEEQGDETASFYALSCERQIREAEELMSYWYRTKLENADDRG